MRVIVGNHRSNLTDGQADEIISNYKMTAFCIPLQVEEGVLLCHTATGELVLLDREEYREIRSGNPLKGAWAEFLAEHLFLPDKETDEHGKVDGERMESRNAAESQERITSFTILPTTCCNARCFYCYEKDIVPKNMALKTAEEVAAFIARSCGSRKVHLSWFGGEPTIAVPVITRICRRLQEQKITYDSSMISNGLLLDEPMVKTAKDCWRLRRIQITIDGTEPVYNAVKNYKDSLNSPFQTVLSNINYLLKQEIYVSVRINLGLHNDKDVSELIREMTERFRGSRFISLYVHEIDNYYDAPEYVKLTELATDFNLKLINENMRSAFDLPSIRFRSCMADSESSLLINPDGQLGKCEHYSYEKLCGSIHSPWRDWAMIKEWQEPIRFPQCRSCPFYASCLPLKWCNGGNFICNDVIVDNKVRITENTMHRLYGKWKRERYSIRNEFCFLLNYGLKVTQDEDGIRAVFFRDSQAEPVRTVSVNCTGRDILLFLQEKHTFRDIADMLHGKYDAAEFCMEDDIEECLAFLLHAGLCRTSI